MKKYHFFTYGKTCMLALMGVGSILLASCAKDGFDDETFNSGVNNTQVAGVSADDIVITPSADGKTQTITWPVVMGAGGYEYQAYNVDDPENPVELANGVVDGVYFTFPKAEDTRYMVKVKTLGNTKLNNTDAPDATSFNYSTLLSILQQT